MTLPLFTTTAGADFSPDRVHRYRLWRRWGPGAPACFCMLNPSTADESELDPTLRRCAGFAKAWGCGGLEVVNLFAVVSPDPSVLLMHPDPVGDRNDEAIVETATRAGVLVVGWGAFPMARERARHVNGLLRDEGLRPLCLGTTKAGHPRHPLYVRKTTQLVEWEAP